MKINQIIYTKNVLSIMCVMVLSVQAVPRIEFIKWGKIIVDNNNKKYTYKDVKLWPTGSRVWDWRETKTQHIPGIQVADFLEFINLVDIIILTRGMQNVLKVPQETIQYAKEKGKEYHVGETREMVKLYNTLVNQGKKVGGLFHSTC